MGVGPSCGLAGGGGVVLALGGSVLSNFFGRGVVRGRLVFLGLVLGAGTSFTSSSLSSFLPGRPRWWLLPFPTCYLLPFPLLAGEPGRMLLSGVGGGADSGGLLAWTT